MINPNPAQNHLLASLSKAELKRLSPLFMGGETTPSRAVVQSHGTHSASERIT